MRTTDNLGLIVWDLSSDLFDHDELAFNWDTIDAALAAMSDLNNIGPDRIQIFSSIPSSGNFPGRLVMLSANTGGFMAWTLIRYDGSNWRTVGPFEIMPSLPTQNNWNGRTIMLSSEVTGIPPAPQFPAWSMVRYDGSAWALIGGTTVINNYYTTDPNPSPDPTDDDDDPTKIKGQNTHGDVLFSNRGRGMVLIDRTSGLYYRVFVDKGGLLMEKVS